MSIRTKLIFALLLTNLMSVGFVGTVAYLKLAQKFNETLMQDAFSRFREDVTAYLKTYGELAHGQGQRAVRAVRDAS